MVYAAESRALDSAGRGQQFAPEDCFEVIFFLLNGPQFQVNAVRRLSASAVRRTRPSWWIRTFNWATEARRP